MKDCGVWKGGEVITGIRGEWDWRLTQATLPDTSQTLPFSTSPSFPPHHRPLAEQLQELEQVLGEFIVCHDLLPCGRRGAWSRRHQMREDTRKCAHGLCTLHTHAQKQVRRSSSHHFKDTMRAMGIHDTVSPNLRVQDISRRRLRGPRALLGPNVFIQYQCLLDVTTCVTSKSVCRLQKRFGLLIPPSAPLQDCGAGAVNRLWGLKSLSRSVQERNEQEMR